MTAQIGLQIGLILLIVVLLSIPVGQYLADIVMDRKTRLDPVFDPVDGAIYWLIGRDAIRRPMNWKAYTFHMLATNLFMVLLIYLILAAVHGSQRISRLRKKSHVGFVGTANSAMLGR